MATLVKRSASPFWYLQFKKGGKWGKRVTIYRHDVSADTRKAREECARQTLREMTEERAEGDSRFEAWVGDFFEQRYAVMPATKLRYETTWRTWLIFFHAREISMPSQVTYDHMMTFLKWRQNPETKGVYRCGRNTAIMEIKILGTIMQEAIRRQFITSNPARGLGLVKNKPLEKPEITAEEEAKIREALQEWPEWMGISFDIAMATGCRLRETPIELRNVDFERGVLNFIQKGGRLHCTILPPQLLPLFQKLKAEGRQRACDMPYMPSKFWWRFFKSIGMPHLSFHSTRVTVVTRLARAGISERHSMRFVGHASSTIHRVYTRLQVDDLKVCVAALQGPTQPTVCSQ